MPVESTNSQYDEYSGQWQKARDCIAGDEQVKQRGDKYLPRLEGMNNGEYNAYVNRALFYNATARTVQGLTGAMFRKAPVLTNWPKALDPNLDNITLTGVSLTNFAKNIGQEVIAVGRGGVIVDMPEKGNPLPYFRFYKAEDITNWQVGYENGVPVLTMVVLKECSYEPKPDDPFVRVEVEMRRVLGLEYAVDQDGNITSKRYFQEVWRKNDGTQAANGSAYSMVGPRVYPNRRGTPFDYIPFQFFGPTQHGAWCEKSPILDLVDANLSHYRTSADLEHGAHFTALPTPWVAGANAKTAALKIGSGTAWMLPEGASAGMLEYTGQGLGALENREKAKREYMAVLGARLLEDQKADAEAAATVAMRHSGENSVLASIADTTGRGLKNCLAWYLAWLGQEAKDLDYAVNKDFFDSPMTPDEMKALVSTWQSGAIGGQALYWNIKNGERLPEDMSFEDWQSDVAENGPSLALMGLEPPPGQASGNGTGSANVP